MEKKHFDVDFGVMDGEIFFPSLRFVVTKAVEFRYVAEQQLREILE